MPLPVTLHLMLDATPAFCTHPLLPTGHLQTLATFLQAGPAQPERTVRHCVTLADGDQIVLHEDHPADSTDRRLAVLLVHGLAGCYRSGYMTRIAGKLNRAGYRTFRMDLRGCGAGLGLASRPYHSGRSEDVDAALRFVMSHAADHATVVLGFSLGANIVLKLLGELGDRAPEQLRLGIAICPPIDLLTCVTNLNRFPNRLYDHYFAKKLVAQIAVNQQRRGDFPQARLDPIPQTIYAFDDLFTAPVGGFGRADAYYAACSSEQFIPKITVPTMILAAQDDPLIPFAPFERVTLPSCVRLIASEHGGDIGFIGRSCGDPDRQWLDWRIIDWLNAVSVTRS